jgi:MFS family permease
MEDDSGVSERPAGKAHPVLFLILLLPLGIASGYVVVTLAYLLSHAGVSVGAIAGLVAVSLFPQTWKVLWAPIVDTTLTTKKWFLMSAVVTGALMIVTAIVPQVPANLRLIEALVMLFSVSASVNAMAGEALMAHATSADEKGRTGGWSQAGLLGGSGLGGGAGLWLAQHVGASWVPGGILGLVCVLSSIAVLFLDEPPAGHRATRYRQSVVNVAKDVWSLARSRLGFLALVLMILPIGLGAASNLWAAVAGDWHASADVVALVNGALGGIISMFGCVFGGYASDVMDRKTAYCSFGVALAICAIAMALAPRTAGMFVVFTGLYAFILGFCFAAFGAVTFEAIGRGAAATKYNLIASVSNISIAYLTMINGWAQTRWGSGGMLYAEAVCGVVAVALFGIVTVAARALPPGAAIASV